MINPSTRLGPVRPGLANAFGIGAVVGVLGGLIGLSRAPGLILAVSALKLARKH